MMFLAPVANCAGGVWVSVPWSMGFVILVCSMEVARWNLGSLNL